MGRNESVLALAHKAVLTALALLTLPVLGSIYLSDMNASSARFMERTAPAWGWLAGLWGLCLAYFWARIVFDTAFREALLSRLSGFRERDEREELVTAQAARSVYLVTLAGFIAAGLLGMVRLNVFAYTRWQGDRVPALAKVGPYELRRGTVEARRFLMWPSLALPGVRPPRPEPVELESGSTQYYYEGGPVFGPEVSRIFFGLAFVQILLLHLFARRVRV